MAALTKSDQSEDWNHAIALQDALECLDHAIVILDPEMRVVACNRLYKQLFSIPDALLRPGTPLEAILSDIGKRGDFPELETPAQVDARLAMYHRREPLVSIRERSDGTVIEITFKPTASGGSLLTFRDITHSSRLSPDLINRLSVLEPLLEVIPLPLYYKDDHRRFLGGNTAFFEFLGVPPSEVIGKRADAFWPPAMAEQFDQADQRLLEEPGAQIFRISLTDSENEVRHIEFHRATFFRPNGSVGGFVGVMFDITDQEAKETFLKQARDILEDKVAERTTALRVAVDAAEAANRAKSDFLANMSHELRTPLNVILGFTEALQGGLFGTMANSKQDEYLENIAQSARHLRKLVDDVLDLARVEAGKMKIEQEHVSLMSVLDPLRSSLVPLLEQQGNQLVFEVDPSGPPLNVDRTRFHQVMLNLLGNACKFTENGRITVTAHTDPSGTMDIRVTDTGIGMSAETLEQIFRPYDQGNAEITRSFGGTGLGLVITKKLTELMNIELTVTSQEGQGTTAILRVPT